MNVKCQACGASFIAPDEKIRGRVLTYKCRRCGAAMRVDGTHLVGAEDRDVQNENRESFLPMAPSAVPVPMGSLAKKSEPADVESGWSEPADVLDQASIPPIGSLKSPGVPRELTPPTPEVDGERATLTGSSASLVAKMMEVVHDDPRTSAVPTARKPDTATLAASPLASGDPSSPATTAGAPTTDAEVAKAGAPAGQETAETPLFGGKSSPKGAPAPSGGAQATAKAAPKPGSPKGATPATPPVAAKPAPAPTRPVPAAAQPAKPAGGKLFDTTPLPEEDDRVFLIGTKAKKPAAAPSAPTEDSGLFDLRALTGAAEPTPPPKPVAHKPPPPARPLPPKPGGSPAKPPPPKPPKPAAAAAAVEVELEASLDVELDASDEETVPAPAAADEKRAPADAAESVEEKDNTVDEPAPSPVAPRAVAAVAAETSEADGAPVPAPDAPPSSESAPVSLSDIEDAPPSSDAVTEVSLGEVEPSTHRLGPAPGDTAESLGPLSQGETEPLPLVAKVPAKSPAGAGNEARGSKPELGASKKDKSTDEIDPFAPLAEVAPLAAPVVAAAPAVSAAGAKSERLAPARVSKPPSPEEVGRGSGSKLAYIVGGLLLLGGAGIFAATRGDAPTAPPADAAARATTSPTSTDTGSVRTGTAEMAKTDSATAASATAEPVAAKEDPAKPATTAGGATASPGGGAVAAAAREPEKTAEPTRPSVAGGDTGKSAPVAAAEPGSAGTPSPSKAEPSEPTKPAEPSKPAEVTPTPVKPLPPAVGTAPIDKGAVASAMGAAASAAGACKPADGTGGVARVSVTFATSGRATQALVNGPPFAGTPTGGCIAAKFRNATIPPFSGEPVTAHKTVSF